MKRKIAIRIEENKCTKRYLLNLRGEIGLLAQNYAVETEMWLEEAQPALITTTTFRPPMRTQPNLPSRKFVPKPAHPTPFKPPQFNQNQPTRTVSSNCHKRERDGHFISQCLMNMPRNFPQGAFPKRPPQAVQNVREEEQLYLDQVKMSQEEVSKQLQYEDIAEYLPYPKDYS